MKRLEFRRIAFIVHLRITDIGETFRPFTILMKCSDFFVVRVYHNNVKERFLLNFESVFIQLFRNSFAIYASNRYSFKMNRADHFLFQPICKDQFQCFNFSTCNFGVKQMRLKNTCPDIYCPIYSFLLNVEMVAFAWRLLSVLLLSHFDHTISLCAEHVDFFSIP